MCNQPRPGNPFRTQREADAYTLLHGQGIDAYDAAFPGIPANRLLDEWADHKLIRFDWSGGAYAIRTFKKYAHRKVQF